MNLPRKLTGSHELVRWLNQLAAFEAQNRITSVIGGKLVRDANGTKIILNNDSNPPKQEAAPA